MPASSIDTILACSIMIILVSSAMVITSMTLHPILNELSHRNDIERYQQLAKYILLTPGTPPDWGSMPEVIPNSFGLASVNSLHPYQLDIDKVSRLNSENNYSITYLELLEAFGVRDVTLRIKVEPLFHVYASLISTSKGENETTYNFGILTKKSDLPVSAKLSCYVISKGYVNSLFSSTSSSGNSSVSFTIPNSANGTALLVSFAKIEPQIVSFNVYSFSHNSSSAPEPSRTFMSLSPLNYALNVSFLHPNEEVLRAQVFSYNYTFRLTQTSCGNQTAEYGLPHLLDSSPMIIVITGSNGLSSFAEWASYPQLPLEMGANLSGLDPASKIVSLTYTVTIKFALYEFNIKFVGPR
jgi:hypothetical protein